MRENTQKGEILHIWAANRLAMLQPLRWCCVDCVIHHERDVREEQHHTYMWREQAIIEWSWRVISGDTNDVNVTIAYAESDHGMWTLLFLAATVRSFAHVPLGISDRNSHQSDVLSQYRLSVMNEQLLHNPLSQYLHNLVRRLQKVNERNCAVTHWPEHAGSKDVMD